MGELVSVKELFDRLDAEPEPGPWTCPEHGQYGLAGKPATGFQECPECKAEAEKQEREFERTCRLWRWWAKQSGIPGRYRSRAVETWKPGGQPAIEQAVRRYTAAIVDRIDAGEGLTLLGPPGLGKTHLLAALTTAACRSGFRAQYASWPNLMDHARQCARSRDGSDPVDEAAAAPFLAIDEIGLGQGTKWEQSQLFTLLDFRYSERRATCIASNLTSAELPERIGERLTDRLREMNATLLLSGQSQREHAHQHPDAPAFPKPEPITIRQCRGGEMVGREIRDPEMHGRGN